MAVNSPSAAELIAKVPFATSTTNNTTTMRFSQPFASAFLLAAAGVAQAASSWSFDDASLTIPAKKGSDIVKEKYGLDRS